MNPPAPRVNGSVIADSVLSESRKPVNSTQGAPQLSCGKVTPPPHLRHTRNVILSAAKDLLFEAAQAMTSQSRFFVAWFDFAHHKSLLRMTARRHAPPRNALVVVLALLVASCGVSRKHLNPGLPSPGDWITTRCTPENNGVAFTDGALHIDTLLWQHKTGGIATTEPIVAGGLLYFASRDRRLEVFDASSGKRLLRERYQGPVTGVLPGDTLFTCTTDQNERHMFFYSYDPVDELAKIDIPTSGAPPRRLSDGSILIAGIHGDLVRFRSDGTVQWTVSAGGPITSPPAIADSLFLVSAGRTVSARRIEDGSVVWSHMSTGAVRAASAVRDSMAYFGSTDSLLYAVTLAQGSMKWFFATHGQIMTSPTIGSDRVYLAANDQLVYALDRGTGRKVWSYNTDAPANTEPTLAGNTLIVSTQTGKLLLLNAITGVLEREFELSAPAATAPVVANNRVYVSDTRRQLYCFGNSRQDTVLTKTP